MTSLNATWKRPQILPDGGGRRRKDKEKALQEIYCYS
jgi:hypothetical protein